MDSLALLAFVLIIGCYLINAAITHFELLALREKVGAALADACSSIEVEAVTLRDLEKAARNAAYHEKQLHTQTNGQWSRSARRRVQGNDGIQFSHQQNNFAQLHAPQIHGEIGRIILPQREHVDRSIATANEAIREYRTLRVSVWYWFFRDFMPELAFVTPETLAGGKYHRGHHKSKFHHGSKSKGHHRRRRRP
jgi:hypothetical protein